MIQFKVFGFTDEVTSCDCCGKSKLKGTFAVEIHATGEILHYGSVCVTRNTGIKNPKSAALDYQKERIAAARAEARSSEEWKAMRARFDLRDTLSPRLQPGRESMEFVRDACRAWTVKLAELRERYKLPYLVA